jgi:hypothetical protein
MRRGQGNLETSFWRDGRVVDGGGLENLIGGSFEFAIFPLNSENEPAGDL